MQIQISYKISKTPQVMSLWSAPMWRIIGKEISAIQCFTSPKRNYQNSLDTVHSGISDDLELGLFCVCACVCAHSNKRPGDGRAVRRQEKHWCTKQTNKAQAAVIKTSLVLVTRRNAAEIAAISDRPRPKLVWDPCSVQLRAFNQQPSVFPPHLARTGFWINSAEQGGE